MIETYAPRKSLILLAGSSGLGKSPLAYQMALCVAAGKPFLGRAVKQGPVLFCDFENGVGQINQILKRQNEHLQLPSLPTNLRIWTPNDVDTSGLTRHNLTMILDEKPDLCIIDTFAGAFFGSEEKNSDARFLYSELRKVIQKTGGSIVLLHHLTKPSRDLLVGGFSLKENPVQWFHQVRGAGSLVQGADVRLGVEAHDTDSLLLAGYGRVTGKIPPIYLERALDEEGEPVGYRPMSGVALLNNKEMEDAFPKLASIFRFKDAQQTYGKGGQATTNWLKKCEALSLIRKTATGYEKVQVVE